MKKVLLAQTHCGSCTFLNHDKHFEAKCSTLGKIPSSRACTSHLPSIFPILNTPKRVEIVHDLSNVMNVLSDTELQALGALMIREKITRKAGYRFGQKVYVRIMGAGNSNFLSNFAVGYVLDATSEYVRVIGDSGKVTMQVINDPNSATLYSVPRFSKMRNDMIAEGALHDANGLKSRSGRAYTSILPLDSAIEEKLISSKKVQRSESDDLVNLACRMGSGIMRTKKEKVRPESTNMWNADGSVVLGTC